MNEECCATCRYWKNVEHEKDTECGDCRRHPPVIITDLAAIRLKDSRKRWEDDTWDQYFASARSDITQFPATQYDQWCGEYKPADKPT